jgi:hypothetical protein
VTNKIKRSTYKVDSWKMKGKAALILIHMQHAIAREDGALAFFGHAKAAKEAGIIPRQQAPGNFCKRNASYHLPRLREIL